MFHILVVEDNDNTRKLMQAVLSQNGYEPIPARDGIEALEVLDRKHIDLIVLDKQKLTRVPYDKSGAVQLWSGAFVTDGTTGETITADTNTQTSAQTTTQNTTQTTTQNNQTVSGSASTLKNCVFPKS